MIDRILIDSLSLKSRDFAVRWKGLIRNESHLNHYQAMNDDELIELVRPIFPLLGMTLDRGFNRSNIGEFFVHLGKQRQNSNFPVSEVIYGLNMAQKVIIEFMMNEFAPENSMRMYQSLGALTKVSEFFLLGSFYVTKGFLEETYNVMSHHGKVSDEIMKKYFTDDFFFKNN
jgi:hypothetical protein